MTKIPLEIIALEDDSYHLLVNVRLNDEIEGKMVLDTGASKTVLDSALALPFAASISETPHTSGIGGEIAVSFAEVEHMEIGDFCIENKQFVVTDLAAINETYEQATSLRIIGLIGSDLLLKHSAIIDYKAKSLQLA